jgi:hypothetical protein
VTTSDRLKKLLVDVTKLRTDYDELVPQHSDSKSKARRLRKELTTTRKRVGEQLELTLAHKEQMKDKEIERECIRFDKAKDNNYTKLLAEERKHLNIQERVDRRYDKADTANNKKTHTQDDNRQREGRNGCCQGGPSFVPMGHCRAIEWACKQLAVESS